jgi:hypothetical protein
LLYQCQYGKSSSASITKLFVFFKKSLQAQLTLITNEIYQHNQILSSRHERSD